MKTAYLLATVALGVSVLPACLMAAENAEKLPPAKVAARKAVDKITVDGKLDEKSWQQAERLPIDVIHAQNVRTEAAGTGRMTWDDENFYISFDVLDSDVQGRGDSRDKADIVPPQDVIEVFIDIDNDPEHFFELHVNPLNGFNDVFIVRPRKDSPLFRRVNYGLMFINGWDMASYSTAVQVNGTLNNAGDKDKGWTVEMQLPFASLMLPLGQKQPRIGEAWRVQLVVQNGGAKDRYMEWSPSQETWFHHGIDTWGRVEFGE